MTITREQRIKAGRRMEVSFYQVWPSGRAVPRGPRVKLSTKEQEKYNHDQAVKKFIRLVNANFGKGDLILTLTFDDDHLPTSWGNPLSYLRFFAVTLIAAILYHHTYKIIVTLWHKKRAVK